MSDTQPQSERWLGGEYSQFFKSVDLNFDTNIMQQFDLYMRAMRIFIKRDEVRGSLWAKFDEDDALSNMRTKFRRIEHMVQNPPSDIKRYQWREEIMDDVFDLMNFSAFLLRHLLDWKPDVQDKPYKEHLDHPYSDR